MASLDLAPSPGPPVQSLGSDAAADAAAGSSGAHPPPASAGRRSPTAWLRRVLRGAQAVAGERPLTSVQGEAYDDASDDGGSEDEECASFGSLPEHLLEKVFSHLRGANRKHHFAICGVNRQWRRLGQAMFFSRPWEVAHLICHPTQLFCLSPRNVTGSRSGLLKCFVRREHGPGGKRFTFCIGKDASQPQRSRFLMAAKQGGRDEVHLFLNSRCRGQPCARLRCNLFATQYKLTLADDLQLEPTVNRSTWDSPPAATGAGFIHQPPVPPRIMSRLQSWPAEAAAEAVAAARGAVNGGPPSPLEVGCLAELQYQARVKGFMQPRKMRVTLPNPLLLFYDHALPHLSRRASMSEPPPSPPAGPAGASGSQGAAASTSAAAAGCASARSLASPGGSSSGSPEASPALAGATAAEPPQPSGGLAAAGLQPSGSGRLGRLLLRMHLRRQPLRPKLLRQQQTVPVDELLQPVVLQNKAPHWNEGLRCWCLNFRGRVKLASVKNFQLVRASDPAERVVLQFGKAEQDAFILDFNPMVLTASQAFGIVLSTFDSKLFL